MAENTGIVFVEALASTLRSEIDRIQINEFFAKTYLLAIFKSTLIFTSAFLYMIMLDEWTHEGLLIRFFKYN